MKKSIKEKRASARFSYISPTTFVVIGDFVHHPDMVDINGKILDVFTAG